jgi:DNA-binding transcriptional regulator LsrR (DeoR family)
VSRMLKEAAEAGIVRTVVVPPPGGHADLEERVRERFRLVDVVVADTEGGQADEASIVRSIGASAANYFAATLTGGERIGVSSWSATLLATVAAMSLRPVRASATEVVQLQGGVGAPNVQAQAIRLVEGLAQVTAAAPKVFPVPGIVSSVEARDALLADDYARELVAAWRDLDTAIVGIGSLQPSELLRTSGNAISENEQARLRDSGAVGDVCLRFFDADGAPVPADLDDRVLAIPRDAYRAIPRKIGVAGGSRKLSAIRAAALGGWIDVLITDSGTAQALLEPDGREGDRHAGRTH